MTRDWPFKGKPNTNAHIQALLSVMFWAAWIIALFLFTLTTMLVTASVVLFLLVRQSVRDIRKEWAKS